MLIPARPFVFALVGLRCTELVGETRPCEPPLVVVPAEAAGAGVVVEGYGFGRVVDKGVAGGGVPFLICVPLIPLVPLVYVLEYEPFGADV
jgi:hypothetical protein